MALLTTITPAKIATARGMVAPEPGSAEERRCQLCIDDALMLIQARVDRLKVAEQTVSQDKLDYVVRQAVVAHLRHPEDGAQAVTVAIDDGQMTTRYGQVPTQVEITDAWWELLGLTGARAALPAWSNQPPEEPARAIGWPDPRRM